MVEQTSLLTTDEVSEFLRSGEGTVDAVGMNTKRHFRVPTEGARNLIRLGVTGITEFSPQDQVLVVGASTPIEELQAEIAKSGHTIPMPSSEDLHGTASEGLSTGTVGGALSLNVPHWYEAATGSWRDWVLGITAVLADGTILSCGSKAVKNVAGYDLHKLFVGARGTLGVVTEVILRTYPWKALEQGVGHLGLHVGNVRTDHVCHWIQRGTVESIRKSRSACEEAGISYVLEDSSRTLWTKLDANAKLPVGSEDWVLRSHCGMENIVVGNSVQRELMSRLKQKLDPTNRLNPGEFGFL